MAIAGLHNVSVLDSSCLRDSRSQASRRRGGEERRSTRASSLLQMWRDFEDEHVVSNSHERDRLREQGTDGVVSGLSSTVISESHGSDHGSGLDDTSVSENESGQWSPNRFGLQNGHEDSGNFNCDCSDLGEVERERVRQIFQEWMNSGARDRASNISHVNHNSRPEWLGETEQERVRIIRGWVQMNSQHRGACAESREEQATEMGDQIEQVLDGLVVNHHSRNEHARRGIRRLCGRQALVDMLKNAEQERQRELQALLEHQAVSNFAHRNRIQSLLRGRFLRNDRMVEDERPRSTAATELGLLRQRHTVSGLREGFFSRLSSCHSDTSSVADINGNRTEQSQVNNLQAMDNFQDQSELNNDENTSHDLSDVRTDIEGDLDENVILQETTIRVEEWQEQVAESEVREWQRSATAEIIESMYDANQVLDEDWRGNTANELSQETLQDEAAEQFHLTEAGEGSYGQPQHAEELAIHGSMDAIEHLESNLIDDVNGQESTANREHWQERVLDEEGELQGAGVESNEWRSGTGDVMEENQEESTANQWPQGHSHPQYGFQEAMRNWLEEPSDPQAFPGGRVDTFYLPDDDNYSMEIRELLSRRRVSNLLQSGFRENLDRLIQSYVERQSHAPVDRELNGTSSGAASAEEDLEQQSRSQNDGQGNAVESPPVALPSTQLPPIQPLWDQDSHNDNWPPHDMHQRFGIEWEMINDLRIDMARLQQRMNNMQRMLEACMDMQVELQRSIRQEVSAALNRSAGSEGMCEDGSPKDGSKWDYVRKGVCCLCCDSNIDSLLYRCGHMCTCSICANELVQSGGKCPMCWAPVVEVIRAYSIL